jgi:hypothetical protein
MLRSQLALLKTAAKKQYNEYNPEITNQMVKLARPIKELAGEVRKLEDRDDSRYEALTYEAKVNLFIEQFFAQLPEEQQVRMLTDMRRVHDRDSRTYLLPEAEIVTDDSTE